MSNTPFVSVVIPTKDMSYYLLFENLPAFTRQTYPDFEVIVLPNEHSQYDLELLKKYKWLRIIPTGTITRPAMKRDIGVKNAQGEIIAFIDDDAYPQKNWLKKAVQRFSEGNAAAVCGPGMLPEKTNAWEKIFDEVLKTWVGSGGYSYRFIKGRRRKVDDYPSMNFLIRKEIFQRLGGFNNDYWPGEDSKLCNDLVHKENEEILYDPHVAIYHHRRTALKPYLKQHANYGFHRGAFFAHGDANSRRFGYLVPSLFVIYLMFLAVDFALAPHLGIPVWYLQLIALPAVAYGLFLMYLSVKSLVNTGSVKVALGSPLTLFLMHTVYGIMFVKGTVTGYTKKEKIYGR